MVVVDEEKKRSRVVELEEEGDGMGGEGGR